MPAGHPEVGDPEKELCARIRTIFDEVHTGEFLAAFHAEQDISCGACHGDEMPELDAEVDNETCFTCH